MLMERLLREKEAYGRIRSELLEKFKGKWVAISNGELVVQGDAFGEVVKRAFELTGGRVFYVTKVGEEQRVKRRVYRVDSSKVLMEFIIDLASRHFL